MASSQYSLDRIKTQKLILNTPVISELLKERNMNISTFDSFQSFNDIPKGEASSTDRFGNVTGTVQSFENPLTLPTAVLKNINNYRFKYNANVVSIYDKSKKPSADGKGVEKNEKGDDKIDITSIHTAGTASLFNPLFNVQIVGFTDNVPLLQDANVIGNGNSLTNNVYYEQNLDDCSVKELVKLSHSHDSILGNARYRYADFMYCKDLGKIPNNHLITLRKFPFPVGDQIYKFGLIRSDDSDAFSFENTGDCGRLITWFGTEENKLEDILKYNYKATWKPLESKIQEIDSKETSPNRGITGMIVNTLSGGYANALANNTLGNHHDFISKMGSSVYKGLGLGRLGLLDPTQHDDNSEFQRMRADANKIYTPANTVQDTHLYEGKLQMSQEISLTFCYKMRGYDNINPKSAMLDLIGNILEVTYRRGQFWGGARKFIGPPPNVAGWNKAKNLIDGAWDKVGGFFGKIASGGSDIGDILSNIAGAFEDLIQNAGEKLKGMINGGGGKLADTAKTVLEKITGGNLSDASKSLIMNTLGRPAMYAMDSLLKADNVGLWHLTIGNPKNPIMSIGNLILTDASIVHSGPLGIDDFPTEVKVTVKLKHGRSRDLSEIAKMYTKGLNSLYIPMGVNDYKDFVPDEKSKDIFDQSLHQKELDQYKSEADKKTAEAKNIKDMQQLQSKYNMINMPSGFTDYSAGITLGGASSSQLLFNNSNSINNMITDWNIQQYNNAENEYKNAEAEILGERDARIQQSEDKFASLIRHGDLTIEENAFLSMYNQCSITATSKVLDEIS